MSDLIKRDDALDALQIVGAWSTKEQRRALSQAYDKLHRVPAVDAVEVVRCKDCMFSRSYMTGNLYCELHENYPFGVYPESFCSRGAKKVGGDDGAT